MFEDECEEELLDTKFVYENDEEEEEDEEE